VAEVESLDPPPPLVLGVPTRGDFTWGSFMRALTDCAALTGQHTITGRDVPQMLGRLGLIIHVNRGTQTELGRARELLTRACTGGESNACGLLKSLPK